MQEGLFTLAKLDDFVPPDHPLRAIHGLVNEALVGLNGLFNTIYAETGRASIAPEKLLRAMLIQVLFSVRSERQLMEQVRYNLLFTWAHQGFAGIPSPVNSVAHLKSDGEATRDFVAEVKAYFSHLGAAAVDTLFDSTKMWSGGLLVGHGAALTYPDLPFAKWSYVDGHGKPVDRNNLPDFMAAADHAYSVLVAWRDGKTAFDTLAVPPAARPALENLLSGSRSTDAAVRLKNIDDALARGDFAPLQERIPEYIPKGMGSWKYLATGILAADDSYGAVGGPPFLPAFETSDYRYFHDAVKEARLLITETVLPAHGVRLI